MSGQIFISYRRDDTAASAGRLYDCLIARFPSSQLFIDVDSVDLGVDFVEAIEKSVGCCDVLIAVIGRNWLTSSGEKGRRRLDDAEDFVRLEIATALKRGIRVIPVLVDGAPIPRSNELPAELKALARRQAFEISHARFRADSERLIDAVERILRAGRAEELPPLSAKAVEPVAIASPKAPVSVSETKEHHFVNSLGMRFVPVPGTDAFFSVWETRVKDYQAFCDATGRSLKQPEFSQMPDHPVVNVSWEDGAAFCEWLNRKEGNTFRLPTDHEWSCAVRIADQEDANATPKSKDGKIADVFPWGKQWPPPNDTGNYCGQECGTPAALAALKAAGYDPSNWAILEGFNDGNVFTAAVGSFRPNRLGICDLGGNVWEWCQDEYEERSASRVLRGGSWCNFYRDALLSSRRGHIDPICFSDLIGFRVVVEASSVGANVH